MMHKGYMEEFDKLIDQLVEHNRPLTVEEGALLKAQFSTLLEQIKLLITKVDKLERKAGLNSNNSSKPPSSDGLTKGNRRTTSLRKNGKNKTGAQRGHKGTNLSRVKNPDKKVTLDVIKACPCCAHDLTDVPVESRVEERQVFDLPPPKIEVTSYVSHTKQCPNCKEKVKAPFPENVKAPTQYGDSVHAMVANMVVKYKMPWRETRCFFQDVFGIGIAEGTIQRSMTLLNKHLINWGVTVRGRITSAYIKHADETGIRVKGKLRWVLVLCTTEETLYLLMDSRGDIPKDLQGFVVHDCWGPYFSLEDVLHVLCNGHILRELEALVQFDKELWAEKMKKFLARLCHLKNRYGLERIASIIPGLKAKFSELVAEGVAYHESLAPLSVAKSGKRGRVAKRKGHNLLLRLATHKESFLRFLDDENIPFTNNEAEGDVRILKVQQKRSGCFRTIQGCKAYLSILSFVKSMKKKGRNVLDTLKEVLGYPSESQIQPAPA